MTWLWILLTVLAVFLLILFVNVKIRVGYREDVTVAISVMGIRIPLVPKRKKKIRLRDFTLKKHQKRLSRESEKEKKRRQKQIDKDRKKKAAKEAKKKEKAKKLPKDSEVSDEPSMVSLLLSTVAAVLDKFFGKLRIEVARVRITVGGEDAAKTAITYGIVAQGVAYLFQLLEQKTRFYRKKNEYISVVPDFLAKKTTADISLVFSVNLWLFINVAFTALIRIIKEKIQRKNAQI